MKALFIVPPSHEPSMIVDAWNSWNDPAVHKTFNLWGEPIDGEMLQVARDASPDVIFYVGGNKAPGLPSHDTFRNLRSLAPLVHLCWDATDEPWHAVLEAYKEGECFSLQVAMDGGTDSPVDMATLTPIDPQPYGQRVFDRSIRCAFAGQNVARAALGKYQHPRWHVLTPLVNRGLVEYRQRNDGSYQEYAAYLKSCQMLLNISHTGSGKAHHVKLRVVEAGFAGCALLEMRQAPTIDWIPEECLFLYSDVEEAAETLRSASMGDKASALSTYVRENYRPQRIYESILARL